jgi:hypothetical protein
MAIAPVPATELPYCCFVPIWGPSRRLNYLAVQHRYKAVGLPCGSDFMNPRDDDEMATRRDQIRLELATLREQKSSEIIALLEEFRRNDPSLWEREGCPEGKADEHWFRTRAFEES